MQGNWAYVCPATRSRVFIYLIFYLLDWLLLLLSLLTRCCRCCRCCCPIGWGRDKSDEHNSDSTRAHAHLIDVVVPRVAIEFNDWIAGRSKLRLLQDAASPLGELYFIALFA